MILVFTSCGLLPENQTSNNQVEVSTSNNTILNINGSVSQMYCIALEALIPEDEGLNSDAKYIAIDMKKLKGIGEEDIESIKEYFKKYNNRILNESFESLKEKGIDKYNNFCLEGILLSTESINIISKNEIEIKCTKFRSGDGAIGLKINVIYEDGKWVAKKKDMLWIS